MFRSSSQPLAALYLAALLLGASHTTAAAQHGASVATAAQQEAPYTFHVTTREVVVDMIAIDARNHPVLDLVPSDLKVFGEGDRSRKAPKAISSLRIVDPSSTSAPSDLPQTDFLGLENGSCMLSYTAHYQLAYDPGPNGSAVGFHSVLIQTKLRGVKLFYRHGYFISPEIAPEDPSRKAQNPAIAGAPPQSSTESTGFNSMSTIPSDVAERFIAQGAPDLAGNSFGSTAPGPGSLCADVYELSDKTTRLPDFRGRVQIGVIYTDFLAVSRAAYAIGLGIPSVTTRTEWIGLDYYGRIWITHPGIYEFQMISDDGAVLEIDDKRVIDLDGIHPPTSGSGEITLAPGPHTIHIPYFQGPRSVALELWVKAPGDKLRIFDTRSFASPPATPAANPSAINRP